MRIRRRSGAEHRRRVSPLLWTASAVAAAVLALGVNGTLSQFEASITNTNNQVQTAGPNAFGFSESLVQNGQPTQICASASAGQNVNCPASAGAFSINKYGNDGGAPQPIAPGAVLHTTVRLTNTVATTTPGGLSGNLALMAGTCTNAENPPSSATPGDLCSDVTVQIECDSVPAFTLGPISLTDLSGNTYPIATDIAPQAFVNCTFITRFPSTDTETTLQDVISTQPLTWTWTQA